ncbi:MAG TPA: Holliday junction resolvase RecU [Bacilli bacterium]|mgnify:CR=1 FL=1|nr:Holliday junction resolvase RecU [Bacilli bacterium]
MNYPNNLKRDYKKNISHRNRGMDLECSINKSNEYYLSINRAVIYKKPTPIGLVDVKYCDNKKQINKAYFKCPSTLDYNGIYKGKYIEFEAKETISKTSFPLSNIHPHQLKHLKLIIEHGGIGFLILKMNNIIYLIKGEDLINFIDNNKRKSLPLKLLEEKAYVIKERINPSLDYLSIVDKIYFKE